MRFVTGEGKHMFNRRLTASRHWAAPFEMRTKREIETKKEPRIRRLSGV
jgi:hypothetical protein